MSFTESNRVPVASRTALMYHRPLPRAFNASPQKPSRCVLSRFKKAVDEEDLTCA